MSKGSTLTHKCLPTYIEFYLCICKFLLFVTQIHKFRETENGDFLLNICVYYLCIHQERSGNFLLPQPLQKMLKRASSCILDGLTRTQEIA
jgi:hypothetical protein